MAKFFLFVFTILLSLSLGLFVGQNYLLTDSSVNTSSKSENPRVSLDTLNLNLKSKFNKFMDKIFANDDVKIVEDDQLEAVTENQSPDPFIVEQPETPSADVKVLTVKKTSEEDVQEPATNSNANSANAENINSNKTEAIETSAKREGWVIQVAAFQEMSDALKVEQQVKEAKFPHYFYKTSINGQNWYRVNVGPFESVSEATNYKQSQKVHQKFKGAFVRQL